MSLCAPLHRSLLVLSLLTSSPRLLAQQYCVSGSVTETHLDDLQIGDPIRFTAQVQSGSQSCTTNAGRTTCSAIVLLEIKSGNRRWSSAALNSKAATIQFIFSAGDTTTRIILGAVVGQSSPPQALSPFNMLGVHIDLGTYSGNFLSNGGFPPALPSISNRPFEPASIYLAGPGGNTTISYTGQECAPSSSGIRIIWKNKDNKDQDITNTTQSAVVGQQITLRAVLPNGIQPKHQSWSIDGRTIGGFIYTDDIGETDNTVFDGVDSTSYYWILGGDAKLVTYSVTLANDQVLSATATFNVAGPPPAQAVGSLSRVEFSDDKTDFAPHAFFTRLPKGVQPSGTFLWAQIILNDHVIQRSAKTYTWTFSGLDGPFPYGADNPEDDRPSIHLYDTYVEVKRDFSALMYLMWNPDLEHSIPVPIGFFAWKFSADATKDPTTHQWTFVERSGSISEFQPKSEFPYWTQNARQ